MTKLWIMDESGEWTFFGEFANKIEAYKALETCRSFCLDWVIE